jgi:hypothetical protein
MKPKNPPKTSIRSLHGQGEPSARVQGACRNVPTRSPDREREQRPNPLPSETARQGITRHARARGLPVKGTGTPRAIDAKGCELRKHTVLTRQPQNAVAARRRFSARLAGHAVFLKRPRRLQRRSAPRRGIARTTTPARASAPVLRSAPGASGSRALTGHGSGRNTAAAARGGRRFLTMPLLISERASREPAAQNAAASRLAEGAGSRPHDHSGAVFRLLMQKREGSADGKVSSKPNPPQSRVALMVRHVHAGCTPRGLASLGPRGAPAPPHKSRWPWTDKPGSRARRRARCSDVATPKQLRHGIPGPR